MTGGNYDGQPNRHEDFFLCTANGIPGGIRKNDAVSLEIAVQNSDLFARVYYDFRSEPLALRAVVQMHDVGGILQFE